MSMRWFRWKWALVGALLGLGILLALIAVSILQPYTGDTPRF